MRTSPKWCAHMPEYRESSELECFNGMLFTKRLREGVRRGFITCSVRIWKRPHVKVRGRYRMDDGEIVIDSVELISLRDITDDLAIESGFESRADLLQVAKHGSGDNVYLIRFHYILPTAKPPRKRSKPTRRTRGNPDGTVD